MTKCEKHYDGGGYKGETKKGAQITRKRCEVLRQVGVFSISGYMLRVGVG